jgi:hypothetical protein
MEIEFIDIIDYEGLYKINKLGEVLNKRNKIMKSKNGKNGYMQITLSKNGNSKTFHIHRLLGIHFIENNDPINKIQIDHIDRNKLNNNLDNLRWTTLKENQKNKNRNGGIYLRNDNYSWKGIYYYYENDKRIQLQKTSKDREIVEKWLNEVKEIYK